MTQIGGVYTLCVGWREDEVEVVVRLRNFLLLKGDSVTGRKSVQLRQGRGTESS